MSISKKEIDDLKKSYELKVKIFNLIRNKKYKKATNLLKKDDDALSYFIKFKSEKDSDQVISLGIGGWGVHYNPYAENKILTDLENIKKEIEEKEARYEQQEYLKQQKEFLNLQKKDIEENKKDRKKIRNFTFVLALGVVATLTFNFYQVFIGYKIATTFHTLLISLFFIFIFIILLSIVSSELNMKKKLVGAIKKTLFL